MHGWLAQIRLQKTFNVIHCFLQTHTLLSTFSVLYRAFLKAHTIYTQAIIIIINLNLYVYQWKSNLILKISRLQKFTTYLSCRDTRACYFHQQQSLELTFCFFLHQIDPYNWTGTNAVLSGKKMWKVKYERLLQKGLSVLCIYIRGDFQFAIENIMHVFRSLQIMKGNVEKKPYCDS